MTSMSMSVDDMLYTRHGHFQARCLSMGMGLPELGGFPYNFLFNGPSPKRPVPNLTKLQSSNPQCRYLRGDAGLTHSTHVRMNIFRDLGFLFITLFITLSLNIARGQNKLSKQPTLGEHPCYLDIGFRHMFALTYWGSQKILFLFSRLGLVVI